MSALFWAVFDEEQKKKSEEILATFDKEAKDEMGMMSIIIALSNQMFPGTSVTQTRLRYIYLVGWIFLEALKSKQGLTIETLHRKEKLLRRELQKRKEENPEEFRGIIGARKRVDEDGDGKELSLPPFAVYFNLLTEWNIIIEPNVSLLDLDINSFCPDFIEIVDDKHFSIDTFILTDREKEYLLGKIPKPSILYTIFSNNLKLTDEKHFVEIFLTLPEDEKRLLEDAQNFSRLMWGTMLYYNYYLGNESDDLVSRFKKWKGYLKEIPHEWKPSNVFENHLSVEQFNHSQKEFVDQWYRYVQNNNLSLSEPADIENKTMETFLKEREKQLKGKRSRLYKKIQGDMPTQASFGIKPIECRWSHIVIFKKDFDATRSN